jgi:hypothetical protein
VGQRKYKYISKISFGRWLRIPGFKISNTILFLFIKVSPASIHGVVCFFCDILTLFKPNPVQNQTLPFSSLPNFLFSLLVFGINFLMENDFLFFGYVDEGEDDDINLKSQPVKAWKSLQNIFLK